jgi:hypothetical protein
MRQLAVVTALVIGGVLAWVLGSRLSADALGMAVGLLFGVLAGVPTALLVMASGRRQQGEEDLDEDDEPAGYGHQRGAAQHFPYQPPVIVLAAPQAAPSPMWAQQQPQAHTVDSVGYPVRQALPGPGAPGAPASRVFRVVGEREEMLDDW